MAGFPPAGRELTARDTSPSIAAISAKELHHAEPETSARGGDADGLPDINTVWGSIDYPGTPPPATLGFGTPRDVFNPRQLQFGAKLKF
jgi:hypothetical protein